MSLPAFPLSFPLTSVGKLTFDDSRAVLLINAVLSTGNGPFSASPTFYSPLQSTLVPTTTVDGGLFSFARANTAYVQDWENILKLGKTDEARFTGARRVENIIVGSSESLANVNWVKTSTGTGSSGPTVTANFATDPIGGSTASRMQGTGGSDASRYCMVYQTITQLAGTASYRCSVWLKANSGTPTVGVRFSSNSNGAIAVGNVTLGPTWVRYTGPVGSIGLNEPIYMSIGAFGTTQGGVGNITTAFDILVWGAMWENVSGQSNQNPSEYISVGVQSSPYNGANIDGVKYFTTLNGNTVASNIITEATGTAITSVNGSALTNDTSGPFGLLVEEARVQTLGSSETFGSWTVVRSSVTADTTASPNGVQTADTLNEDSTTNTHIIFLGIAKAASPVTYAASIYVKASGRTWVNYSLDDGSTGNANCYFDVQNGVVGTAAGNGGFTVQATSISQAANGFWRCQMVCTSTSVTLIRALVTTASGDGVTSVVGLNGAALILWGNQVEPGTFSTSYMPVGAGVGRAYDGFTYTTFAGNTSATVGTAYVETKTEWITSTAAYPLVSFGVATLYPLYVANGDASTVIRTNDGTTSVSKTGVSNMNSAMVKVAASWTTSVSKLNVTGGGSSAASGTFDGSMGSAAIGVGNPTTGTGVVWNGNVRNLKLYTAASTATQLATLTT